MILEELLCICPPYIEIVIHFHNKEDVVKCNIRAASKLLKDSIIDARVLSLNISHDDALEVEVEPYGCS